MLRPWIPVIILSLALFSDSLLSAEQRARLDLRVNQKRIGEIEVFFRGDDIMTRVADLKSAGVEFLGGRLESIHGVQHVSLKSLARDLTFEMNEMDLSLRLTTKQAVTDPKAPSARPMTPSPTSPVEVPIKRDMASGTDLQARLALLLDGARRGEIAVIVRGQDVLARLTDVAALDPHLASGQREIIRGETYVSLKSLSSNLTFSVDEENLNLSVMSRRKVAESDIAAAKSPAATPAVETEEPVENYSKKITDQRAIFEVKVNTARKGETDVILRGEDVLARVKDLQGAGMVSVNGRQEKIRGETYASLRSLAPMLSFSVNEIDLTLDLTLIPEAFGEHILAGGASRPEKMEYREDTSGFVNYALNARDFKSLDAFSEVGLTVKNALLYSGLSRNTDGAIVRGFSNVTINKRDDINRIVIGDRLVNSDFLGGSVTLGGLSYFRDFTLDPYFIRNPGLNYAGAVSTPSTLEVYSNGIVIRRVPLAPGQFQIKDLPLQGGSNDTRFVIRDAFGRERELGSEFFYYTSGLLKPGLHDFRYNLGSQREDIASKSWGYGLPVFIGHHRYGFTDYLTAGLRLEGTKGLISGGPSFSFLLPTGEMEIASAASSERGVAGAAGFLGYSYVNGRFSFGSSIKAQSEHYATTSLSAKKARSWLESGASTAFALTDSIGVSVRYAYEDSRLDSPIHKIQLRASAALGKLAYLFIDGNLGLRGGAQALGFGTGLSITLDGITGSLSYQNDQGKSSGITEVRKSLPVGPGYGYGFQANTRGDLDSVLQYQTSFGRYDANYRRIDGRQESSLSAAGGLAFIDRNVSFTRPVQNGFALIRVPDLGGIRGYLNNLEVGSTDTAGRLFVPNLLSYYGNRVSISRKDLPLNYNSDVVDKIVAAPYRGGVLVDFPVARIQRIVGKAVIESGGKTMVPKYGQLTLTGQGTTTESPLGNNGEFYFENLKTGRYHAQIETSDHSCDFTLEVPQVSDAMIQLGTVSCVAQ